MGGGTSMDACREDMEPLHTSVMLGIETCNLLAGIASNAAGVLVQSGSFLSRFSGFYQSFFVQQGRNKEKCSFY